MSKAPREFWIVLYFDGREDEVYSNANYGGIHVIEKSAFDALEKHNVVLTNHRIKCLAEHSQIDALQKEIARLLKESAAHKLAAENFQERIKELDK